MQTLSYNRADSNFKFSITIIKKNVMLVQIEMSLKRGWGVLIVIVKLRSLFLCNLRDLEIHLCSN